MSRGPIKHATRHAFTIIEVVMVVIVLGIAVPPTLEILMSNASQRADTINTARATTLASSVLEAIVADTTSSDETLGYDALADAAAYLSTPTTGLYARLAPVTDAYTSLGITYSVTIGSEVGSDGQVSATPEENVFRVVTVRVNYPSSSGASYSLPVSVMVGEI